METLIWAPADSRSETFCGNETPIASFKANIEGADVTFDLTYMDGFNGILTIIPLTNEGELDYRRALSSTNSMDFPKMEQYLPRCQWPFPVWGGQKAQARDEDEALTEIIFAAAKDFVVENIQEYADDLETLAEMLNQMNNAVIDLHKVYEQI